MPKSRRSRWWFALIVVPVMLGALGVVHGVGRLTGTLDAMVRVSMPGTQEVELPAGDLTVYAESDTDGLSCGLTDATSGEAIALRRPRGSTTYTWGDHHGQSVLEFTSPHAGRYVMTCTTDGGVRYGYTRLAIGRGLGWPIVELVVAALGGLLGAGLTAVGVWLWRRRATTAI